MGILSKENAIQLIKDWWVVYFKNKSYASEAPPHYHISIPTINNNYLILCIITTQREKKIGYYERFNSEALKSLVSINQKDLTFLSNDSLIDCNQPITENKTSIDQIIEMKSFKICPYSIPDKLKPIIICAIKNSPIVRPEIIKMIKTNSM